MSLVQCVLTKKFIITAADMRAVKPNGDTIEYFNKLSNEQKNNKNIFIVSEKFSNVDISDKIDKVMDNQPEGPAERRGFCAVRIERDPQ